MLVVHYGYHGDEGILWYQMVYQGPPKETLFKILLHKYGLQLLRAFRDVLHFHWLSFFVQRGIHVFLSVDFWRHMVCIRDLFPGNAYALSRSNLVLEE